MFRLVDFNRSVEIIMARKKESDELPFNLVDDLKYAMRKQRLKKGKGKKARSLMNQLLDLFDWE